MSLSHDASGDMEWFHRGENMAPSVGVCVRSVNLGAKDDVDWPPDQRRKLVLNIKQLHEAQTDAVLHPDEEVYVAVRPEVLPEHRAEDEQLLYLPTATQGLNILVFKSDSVPVHVCMLHMLFYQP